MQLVKGLTGLDEGSRARKDWWTMDAMTYVSETATCGEGMKMKV
jgi:hypothetical protein